jgi:hypothetical protein
VCKKKKLNKFFKRKKKSKCLSILTEFLGQTLRKWTKFLKASQLNKIKIFFFVLFSWPYWTNELAKEGTFSTIPMLYQAFKSNSNPSMYNIV